MYAQLCVKRSATLLRELVFLFARQLPGRALGEARLRNVGADSIRPPRRDIRADAGPAG
jgi:hypothetical protein